jgi:ribonuclease D
MMRMSLPKLPAPEWVATEASLQRMITDLVCQSRLAVDTESNSLHAYREQVCLIQFSTPQVDYLVDPLSLDNIGSLAPIFADPKVEKVFHAAEYDLICLVRDFGFRFANLFDTMQAAHILGYRSVGLDKLLTEKFGVEVDKRYQKSDWGERPLSREKISYARLDTHYLLALRDALEIELKEKGRWPLAREDFERACLVENGLKAKDESRPWMRISGQQELSPRQLTVLNELCLCREKIAERLDRPVFKVVTDRVLLTIARSGPQSVDDLASLGLSSRQIRFFGNAILQSVQRGRETPLVQRARPRPPSEAFMNRLEALKSWRKCLARSIGVESDVVLPRSLLYAIAERAPCDEKQLAGVMETSPWRMAHYGGQILNILNGHA